MQRIARGRPGDLLEHAERVDRIDAQGLVGQRAAVALDAAEVVDLVRVRGVLQRVERGAEMSTPMIVASGIAIAAGNAGRPTPQPRSTMFSSASCCAASGASISSTGTTQAS